MKLGKSLTRIRRFLRDPNAKLWETEYLRVTYNNVQRDMAMQHRCLEDVEALRVPPAYQWSYLHDWEWAVLPATEERRYRALRLFQQSDYVASYRWEVQQDLLSVGVQSEDGAMWTHPWEAWTDSTAVSPPFKFPAKFHVSKGLYYDKEPLPYVDKSCISSRDTQYRFRSGDPVGYWREDDLSNEFYAYPKPSTIDWQDEISQSKDFVYTYSFESALLDGAGGKFTLTSGENELVYRWEADPGLEHLGYRGMWLFEADQGGILTFVTGDTTVSDFGTITSRDGTLIDSGFGAVFDVISSADNFLLIYESLPEDLQDESDESEWPEWAQKYIECGVLERAFAANTDGKIKSLENYWATRARLGEKVIKKWRSNRLTDRRYQFRTGQRRPLRTARPRLPDTYPSV